MFRISKVIEAAPRSESDRSEAVAGAAQLSGAAQYGAFVAGLRERADIEINKKNLEAK
jgi:hypothetical protein